MKPVNPDKPDLQNEAVVANVDGHEADRNSCDNCKPVEEELKSLMIRLHRCDCCKSIRDDLAILLKSDPLTAAIPQIAEDHVNREREIKRNHDELFRLLPELWSVCEGLRSPGESVTTEEVALMTEILQIDQKAQVVLAKLGPYSAKSAMQLGTDAVKMRSMEVILSKQDRSPLEELVLNLLLEWKKNEENRRIELEKEAWRLSRASRSRDGYGSQI